MHKTNIGKKTKIQTKLTIAFMAVAVFIVIVGSITVYTSQTVLRDTIGENTILLAEETLRQVSQDIFFRIEEMQVYAKDQMLEQYLTDSNKEFEALDDIQAYIDKHDKDWISDTESSKELIQQLENNSLSEELQGKVDFYNNKYGHMIFSEIFIANKYGANIAQTRKTEDYYQADEGWWQKSKEEGFYMSDVVYDQSSEIYAITVSVRIDSSEGDFMGVVKAVLNLYEITNIVDNIKYQYLSHLKHSTVDVKLIDKNDKLLYSTGDFKQFEDVSQELYSRYGHINNAQHRDYYIGMGSDGNKKLFSHAHMQDYRDFKSLGWRLIVEHNTREIFAPAYRLRYYLSLITALMFIVAFLLGSIISRRISKPAADLKDALSKINEGNIGNVPRIAVKSQDEIGSLTDVFNKVFDDLKLKTTSINNLDKEISVRKKIELDLRIEKDKLNVILDSTLAGIVLIDAQTHKIVEVNPMAVQMIGAPKEDIVGKACNKFICPAEVGKCPITDLDQGVNNVEGVLLSPRGGNTPILKTVGKVMLGDKLYLVESFMDITKRKEVEQLKDEFISTVSHELRTPLSIIKEGISLVLDEIPGKINKDQKDILQTAKDSTGRLTKIINSLLDISKFEAKKVELERTDVKMSDLAGKVYDMFKNLIEDKGLSFTLKDLSEESMVYIDEDKVVQVFTNLVGNALKFTKQGKIDIIVKDVGSEVECMVFDTGIGIAKKDLPNVFNKFEQFGRTPGPGIKGTGLGLSISKNIVEIHGGQIWVESELGKSTKFIFTLPKIAV
ncbi:MAG: ATP-binding protein [Candidatus Kaelpia aquatica]|nr:ATP-binding protein [Candidatus Kaelpia aquatica]